MEVTQKLMNEHQLILKYIALLHKHAAKAETKVSPLSHCISLDRPVWRLLS